MRRLTQDEFNAKYDRRPPVETYCGLYHRDLHIESDATMSGLVEGTLYIHGSAHVVIGGLVNGPTIVDRDAVVWVEGLLEGRIQVEGAAFLNGTCSAHGNSNASIYDPTEPADSETEPVPT